MCEIKRLRDENGETQLLRAELEKSTEAAERAQALCDEMKAQRDAACNDAMKAREQKRLSDEAHASELDRCRAIISQKDEEYRKTVARLESESLAERESAKQRYEALHEKYSLLMARAHATEGSGGADFTSREEFLALEAEYRAFEKFFNAEWKKAKTHIRKTRLSRMKNSDGKNTQTSTDEK